MDPIPEVKDANHEYIAHFNPKMTLILDDQVKRKKQKNLEERKKKQNSKISKNDHQPKLYRKKKKVKAKNIYSAAMEQFFLFNKI